MMQPPGAPRRIVVAITGASGAVYGVRAVEMLRGIPGVETHLIITAGARKTLAYETETDAAAVMKLADAVYHEDDLAAPVSSGSYRTEGMLVIPCSIKTLSGVANCYDDNLVVRAADVTLKERRRLVLVVRETPLHLSHLRLMTEVTAAGGIIAPPVPAFYHHPRTVDDIVDQTVGRALDLFGLDAAAVQRWEGSRQAAQRSRANRDAVARADRGAGGGANRSADGRAGQAPGPAGEAPLIEAEPTEAPLIEAGPTEAGPTGADPTQAPPAEPEAAAAGPGQPAAPSWPTTPIGKRRHEHS